MARPRQKRNRRLTTYIASVNVKLANGSSRQGKNGHQRMRNARECDRIDVDGPDVDAKIRHLGQRNQRPAGSWTAKDLCMH